MKLSRLCMQVLGFGVVLSLLTMPVALAAPNATLVRSEDAGWPQFRGPARDGISQETGLLTSWPEDGPKLLWHVSDLGNSYSSPIVTDAGIFITGDVGDDLIITAIDKDGQILWKKKNGDAWRKSYPGGRASCTYDDGRLFHMNAHGRAVRLDPKTGDEQWVVNVLDRFEGEIINWGLSESVLVDDDRVFVTPGGKKAFMAALDADTGTTVWASTALQYKKTYGWGGKDLDAPEDTVDHAGYAPPILFDFGGRRIIARSAGHHAVCVDAESGEMLWTYPIFAAYGVIGTTPVLWNNNLIFAAPDEFGTTMFRLSSNEGAFNAEKVWDAALDNCHGGLVVDGDRLYGSGYRRLRDWVCIDASSGEILYATDELAKGAVLFAEGLLYAQSENGMLSLLEPGDGGFHIKGQIKIGDSRRKDVWAHPVIVDGRLYVRDMDQMWCYDIRR